MPTIQEYLDLITSQYRQQPNYTQMVSDDVSPSVRVQELLEEMIEKFDVDVAVGDQLDIIGKWVGVSRNVAIPITNVYFSWDSDQFLGWDFGSGQPSNAPADVTVLPDDTYRTLIKAKIAANRWDGTIEGAYEVWDSVFTDIKVLIQDNQNMTMALGFVGGIIDSLTLALITGGYIPLKPSGVRITDYFFPVDTGPMFAYDVDTEFLAGWDEGSWAREITPL